MPIPALPPPLYTFAHKLCAHGLALDWLPDPGYQVLAIRSWLQRLPDRGYQILAATAMRAALRDESIDFHFCLETKRDLDEKK